MSYRPKLAVIMVLVIAVSFGIGGGALITASFEASLEEQINAKSMVVLRDGIEIPLTKKEYEILLLFARNPGIVLYKSQIYERVWGDDYPDSTRTVELHVQRMKKKVGWQDMIKPVFALGYRLEVSP